VAETYIPKPKSREKLEINHKDGNKENCRPSNLEWVTHQQNMKHAHAHGLYDQSNYFREWAHWPPEQLIEFEKSPYNIPACGNYAYPKDLEQQIETLNQVQNAA
jgi:hypothetical protein